MKKLYIILTLAICFLFLSSSSTVLAAPAEPINIYTNFIIHNGLSVRGDKEDGINISVDNLFSFAITDSSAWSPKSVSCSQANCNRSFLVYSNAPNYQNAQCSVDGTPKSPFETFALSTDPSNPTQIVCTAEPIPDPGAVDLSVSLTDTSYISGAPSNINLNIHPTTAGAFNSTSFDITVGSNYADGYSLILSTPDINLTSTTTGTTIPTLTSTATADTFPVNTWGYSTDGTNFQPIQTSQQLDYAGDPTNSSTTHITLAAKADNSIPSGAYSNILTFTIVPNVL